MCMLKLKYLFELMDSKLPFAFVIDAAIELLVAFCFKAFISSAALVTSNLATGCLKS